MGVGYGSVAVEVFYDPAWQLAFAETGTKIKTPSGVYVPEETPNFEMALHRVGLRVVWSLGASGPHRRPMRTARLSRLRAA